MAADVEALVRRAQTGERQALAQLVELHQQRVYHLALAIMRDPADAADMTQETFVRLLRSLGSYRGDGGAFGTWLHRLTVNLCLDGLRRRGRGPVSLDARVARGDAWTNELVCPDVWQQPEWWSEWRESATEVRAALAELPVSQRVALTLHYLEASSYEQIAVATGVPLNTVKSHILRGKARLARLLRRPLRQPTVTTAPCSPVPAAG